VTTTDLLLVGRVARAHGNRGQVIVNAETDFPDDRFKAGNAVLVGPAERAERREIRDVRFHRGRPILTLSGVESMNEAEALAGAELWVPAAALAPLPAGTFYRHDLIGCEVADAAGAALGTVSGVEGTLDRSYLVVKAEAGEVMIPMVAEFCVNVDLAARRITVSPPDGLFEIYATPGRAAAERGARTPE
jgi:16S rRNA processing protein RimM